MGKPNGVVLNNAFLGSRKATWSNETPAMEF